MPARSPSGARWPKGRCRRRVQPWPGLSPRQACRSTSPQARRWLERAARKGHVDAQATLGLLLFQNGDRSGGDALAQAGRRRRRAARACWSRHRAVQRRRRRSAIRSGLCLCQPRRGAGLAPAKATLADMDEVMPLERAPEGRRAGQVDGRGQRRRRGPRARQAGRGTAPRPSPSPPAAKRPSRRCRRVAGGGDWRIQLGAFGQRASAEALFGKLSRHSSAARSLIMSRRAR